MTDCSEVFQTSTTDSHLAKEVALLKRFSSESSLEVLLRKPELFILVKLVFYGRVTKSLSQAGHNYDVQQIMDGK